MSIFDDPPEYRTISDVKKLIDGNFKYVSDQEKWGMEHYAEPITDGTRLFSGDCEEYSGAALLQLLRRKQPAGFYVVKTKNNVLHMLTCTPNYCIDNLQSRPFTRDEAHNLYNWSTKDASRNN